MRRCGDVGPDPYGACLLPEGKHPSHSDGSHWWPDEAVQAELARRPAKVQERRGRAKRTVSNEGRSVMLQARARMGGPTDDPAVWREQVLTVLAEFLETHEGDFTTPEHIWPLLPDPNVDRRNMQKVIQEALRRGMIVKTGQTKWLGENYHTSDGHTFELNKHVMQYRRAS